jgi:hypothetical protein
LRDGDPDLFTTGQLDNLGLLIKGKSSTPRRQHVTRR